LTIVTRLVGLPEDGRDNMLNWAAAAFEHYRRPERTRPNGIESIKEMRHWINTSATPRAAQGEQLDGADPPPREDGRDCREIAPLLIRDYINPSLDTTISRPAS